MPIFSRVVVAALALFASHHVSAASCSISVPTTVPAPVVRPGYQARLIATGLHQPRGIIFDNDGHLLVVEQYQGVSSLTLIDDGGSCVGVNSIKSVVTDNTLNHGLEISNDNSILYASSSENVYSYPYTPSTSTADVSKRLVLITNMTNTDHVTRTLLLPQKAPPGTLVVARGSTANIDPLALQKSSGHSQIKAFSLQHATKKTLDFVSAGKLLGWGLRNDVGVAQHPVTGGVYSVENNLDDMTRDGVDIHENDPGEELNFLGFLLGAPGPNQGANFGYPLCFPAWNIPSIPQNAGITVGSQFAIGNGVGAANDTACRKDFVAPRLVFEPHMAPLDIKFNATGSVAYVTFHGSHDRNVADGYKVGFVDFDASSGEPIEPSTSKTALVNLVTNPTPHKCTPTTCFRPVGMAFDKKGRLFFSSDDTGEIYIITKADGSGLY